MASITKNGSKWRAFVCRSGVRKSKTFQTKREAETWAANVEHRLLTGEFLTTPLIPFSFLVEKYLLQVTPHKRSAVREEAFFMRFLKLPIARVMLPNMSEQDWIRWRDERLKSVAPATVLREWATLANLLAIAKDEWKIIPRNYLKGVKKPKAPPPRFQRWSDDAIRKLLFVARFEPSSRPQTLTDRTMLAFLFAIETAMRLGEICSLTWENVHFERRLVHIPQSKNGWPRDVPLSSKALDILTLLWSVRTNDLVFCLNIRQCDALFRKVKNQALLKDLHFHDTRREALTRLAKKVDVMTLAKISGHRDLSILQNTYYAPRMDEVAALLD